MSFTNLKKVSNRTFLLLLPLFFSLFISLILLTFPNKETFPYQLFDQEDYQTFQSFAYNVSVKQAYQELKTRYAQNEPKAHDFAHVVGIVSYKKSGVAGLSICDPAYNYGCYHGFIESFLQDKGVEKVFEVEKSCQGLGMIHSPSCLHGIGHGLAINASYNLRQALTDCDRLEESSQTYCWDGVFMENIVGSMLGRDQKPKIVQSELKEPCARLDKKYREQCFRNQVRLWFSFFAGNTKKIAEECATLEREYQKTCFESMGLIIVSTSPNDQEKIIASCQVETAEASDNCLLGAVKELMFEGKPPQIAQNLCFVTSEKTRQECFFLFQELEKESRERFEKKT